MDSYVALADRHLVALAEIPNRQAESYHIPLCTFAEHQDSDLLDIECSVEAWSLVVVQTLDWCGIHIHIILLFYTLPIGDTVFCEHLGYALCFGYCQCNPPIHLAVV